MRYTKGDVATMEPVRVRSSTGEVPTRETPDTFTTLNGLWCDDLVLDLGQLSRYRDRGSDSPEELEFPLRLPVYPSSNVHSRRGAYVGKG